MPTETHQYDFHVEDRGDIYGFRADCSCGWEGRRLHEEEEEAVDEWEFHCEDVFMAATSGRDMTSGKETE